MRAAAVTGFSNPPVRREFAEPEPVDGEVMIEMRAVAVSNPVRAVAAGKHYSSAPSNNTILTTGGSRGIGRALVEQFHARGNTVIIAGRDTEALAEVTRANPGMHSTGLDVADPASITRAATTVLAAHPGLKVLFNNAGIMFADDPGAPVDEDRLERIIATNLLGPIRMISAFIEHLRATPGAALISVSSMVGYAPLASCSRPDEILATARSNDLMGF